MSNSVKYHTIYPCEEIPEAYFSTRYAILRQPIGMPMGSERLDDDHEAIHCYITFDQAIIAVGRLHLIPPESDGAGKDHGGPGATAIPPFGPLVSDDEQYRPAVQIRQMGTREEHRNKGYAKEILNLLEQEGKAYFKAKVGFLQAREIAVDFYKKSGWYIIDDPYSIGKIGLHRSMMKHF
jgi:GNAT superfamily N-acetyltransferase